MEDIMTIVPFIIIPLIIIGMIVGLIVGVVDTCCRKPLEEVKISCVITHMDIDDGSNLISVVSLDGSFSGTIQVASAVYSKYDIGDACTVTRSGYHYPISGADELMYRIR